MVALRDRSVLAVQPAAKAKQKTAVQGDFIGDSPNRVNMLVDLYFLRAI